jgi:hypothetical protein
MATIGSFWLAELLVMFTLVPTVGIADTVNSRVLVSIRKSAVAMIFFELIVYSPEFMSQKSVNKPCEACFYDMAHTFL